MDNSSLPLWERFLGRAWVPGEFDCWALVREVYQQERGIELPLAGLSADVIANDHRALVAGIENHPVRAQFRLEAEPEHLAVCEFISAGGYAHHVGVYLETPNGPHVLHNPGQMGGVVCVPHLRIDDKLRYWVM